MQDIPSTTVPVPPELAADAERWERELEWAENAVDCDPTNAYDVSRRTARELEARAAESPEYRRYLAELVARARVELVRMREAAERYRAEGRARERHYHERELYEIHLPVDMIRQPTAE